MTESATAAPSPFLKDTYQQFAWDSTSLALAKTCLRKYYLTMVCGWRPKSESVHLTFGGELASSLELYHKLRVSADHEEALDAVVSRLIKATAEWNPDHPKKNRDTLFRSVIWYLDAYKDDPATTYILEDGSPAVELSFKIELPWEAAPGQPYLYCGHMDRVVNYADQILVTDQKTTGGGIGAYFFKQFNPHTQMSGYSFAGKAILNTQISGVMIDAIQVLPNATNFARGFTNRTQAQVDEWLHDTRLWTTILKFSAERNYWPINEESCHKYDGCQFREVCSQDPAVRDNYLETYFEKRPWNPLVPR